MINSRTYKTIIIALLAALGYALSTFVSFPTMAPFQHFVNVLAAVFVGPWGALVAAFITGALRVVINGTSVLAIIGAVVGAFLSGWLYRFTNKFIFAFIGEIIGTGVISAIISVPVMIAFYGLAPETPFYFYIPFFTPSSAMGGALGVILLIALKKAKVLNKLKAWDDKKIKSDSLEK